MEPRKELIAPREPVRFGKLLSKQSKRFFAFVICSAVLVAAFAISGIWARRGSEHFPFGEWFGKPGEKDSPESTVSEPDQTEPEKPETKPADGSPEPNAPKGTIISKDLSLISFGEDYIQNETVYRPDVASLRLTASGASQYFDPSNGPVVLILHTHATEAYLSSGTDRVTGEIGNAIYSTDASRSVLAVGEALCKSLNEKGVPAVQCREIHGDSGTLRNAYAHAAECIERYLERYPSIQYVIDVHRDGILTSNGACVRTLAGGTPDATAQVMAVVGTDGNGTDCPAWQTNLALALRLRDQLNRNGATLCRPVSLRNSSYNQELAPASLLLEIGSAGNDVSEAIRAAELVAVELALLILGG